MENKLTKGRQKIEIKYIENNEARLICFSKRKAGILKKASELTNMCGAEVGLIITTPGGKHVSFGSPSIEAITDRFLKRQSSSFIDRSFPFIEANRRQRLKNLNDYHKQLMQQLMAAKEKHKSLKQISKAIRLGNERDNVAPGWWEVAPEDVEPQDMVYVANEMDKFIDNVEPFTTPPGRSSIQMMMNSGNVGGIGSFQMDGQPFMGVDQVYQAFMGGGQPMVGGQATMNSHQAFMGRQTIMGGQSMIKGPTMSSHNIMSGQDMIDQSQVDMDAHQALMFDQTIMGGQAFMGGQAMMEGHVSMDGHQAFMGDQTIMGGLETLMGGEAMMNGQVTMDGHQTLMVDQTPMGGQVMIESPYTMDGQALMGTPSSHYG